MVIKTLITKEVLAERYMTLKVQADKLKREMDEVADKLLSEMKAGEKIETDEYKLLIMPGRGSIGWTDAGKEKKKLFEEELMKQGFMEAKVGKPFVQGRFTKGGVDQ